MLMTWSWQCKRRWSTIQLHRHNELVCQCQQPHSYVSIPVPLARSSHNHRTGPNTSLPLLRHLRDRILAYRLQTTCLLHKTINILPVIYRRKVSRKRTQRVDHNNKITPYYKRNRAVVSYKLWKDSICKLSCNKCDRLLYCKGLLCRITKLQTNHKFNKQVTFDRLLASRNNHTVYRAIVPRSYRIDDSPCNTLSFASYFIETPPWALTIIQRRSNILSMASVRENSSSWLIKSARAHTHQRSTLIQEKLIILFGSTPTSLNSVCKINNLIGSVDRFFEYVLHLMLG